MWTKGLKIKLPKQQKKTKIAREKKKKLLGTGVKAKELASQLF